MKFTLEWRDQLAMHVSETLQSGCDWNRSLLYDVLVGWDCNGDIVPSTPISKLEWYPRCNIVTRLNRVLSWWRHEMETYSESSALCAVNSPATGEFPVQRPVTRSGDIFFDPLLNKRLSKQPWGWWYETPSRSLWRHCNVRWTGRTLAKSFSGRQFTERKVPWGYSKHWKQKDIMMLTLSSLMALRTCATSDDKIGFQFIYRRWDGLHSNSFRPGDTGAYTCEQRDCVIITVVRLMKPTAVGFIRYGRRRSDRIRTARFVW